MADHPVRDMHRKVEILRLEKVFRNFEYVYEVQLAINGVPAIPGEVPASIRELYPTDEAFIEYCARQAETFIALYGDARDNRIVPIDSYDGLIEAAFA